MCVFKAAGIDIVAVSTDSVPNLKKSVNRYCEGPEDQEPDPTKPRPTSFPFPLVADPDFTVFKKFGVFDDFENLPLHGTFLIDSAGLIRWMDVSYEPFMEAEFLLKECKRLLAQDPPERD